MRRQDLPVGTRFTYADTQTVYTADMPIFPPSDAWLASFYLLDVQEDGGIIVVNRAKYMAAVGVVP